VNARPVFVDFAFIAIYPGFTQALSCRLHAARVRLSGDEKELQQ
jgi:hypothetical protein